MNTFFSSTVSFLFSFFSNLCLISEKRSLVARKTAASLQITNKLD